MASSSPVGGGSAKSGHDPQQEIPADDIDSLAQKVFNAQPFSKLLGAELVSAGPGSAEIRVKVRDELLQQHGYVHGGVLSYLADNALTFAGGLALRGDALTVEYKINYVAPAEGDVVVARAQVVATTRRQAVCQCSLFAVAGDDERMVAVSQGTIARRSS